MRKYSHNPTLEQRQQQTESELAKISDQHQAAARELCSWKRANGLKVRSLAHIASDLKHLDKHAGGQPFREVAPARLTEHLADMRSRFSPATTYSTAGSRTSTSSSTTTN